MDELISEQKDEIFIITLNRVKKHNAFDDHLLILLQKTLDEAIANPTVRVILLKANGPDFSAGADLSWMQRISSYTEAENQRDAMVLARVMYTLNQSPKPTIAMVQGDAYGGGAGLVAACDIAIAGESARFCFSEVKLGLIPAVISPYVIQALGERSAKYFFISAEVFDGLKAKKLHFVHHCVPDEELWSYSFNYAKELIKLAPLALGDCKTLIQQVAGHTINEELIEKTAALIAKKRVSPEGKKGIAAFLNKEIPDWN